MREDAEEKGPSDQSDRTSAERGAEGEEHGGGGQVSGGVGSLGGLGGLDGLGGLGGLGCCRRASVLVLTYSVNPSGVKPSGVSGVPCGVVAEGGC